jgi:hypothetical protein
VLARGARGESKGGGTETTQRGLLSRKRARGLVGSDRSGYFVFVSCACVCGGAGRGAEGQGGESARAKKEKRERAPFAAAAAAATAAAAASHRQRRSPGSKKKRQDALTPRERPSRPVILHLFRPTTTEPHSVEANLHLQFARGTSLCLFSREGRARMSLCFIFGLGRGRRGRGGLASPFSARPPPPRAPPAQPYLPRRTASIHAAVGARARACRLDPSAGPGDKKSERDFSLSKKKTAPPRPLLRTFPPLQPAPSHPLRPPPTPRDTHHRPTP